MKTELKILMLEDNIHDAELIHREMRKLGIPFDLQRVDTQEAFSHVIENDPPAVILSDHGLPAFNGFEALAIARKKCPDVPFIFVTGLAGQEKEIETFERGAMEYVLKSQLSRIVPVVRRAMRAAEERAERRRQEKALHQTEDRFRALVEGVKDHAICMLDRDGHVCTWNTGAEWIQGYTAPEIIGRHFSCFYTVEGVAAGIPARAVTEAAASGRFEEETVLLRRGGPPFWADVVITALRDEKAGLYGFALIVRDVSARKQMEAERERLIQDLENELASVKILSGLLPLCASCKKVRDYEDRWHPLEAYLRRHSEVTLTHEFCPDCSEHIQSENVKS
jgi:PAS domain S-box-containing protein